MKSVSDESPFVFDAAPRVDGAAPIPAATAPDASTSGDAGHFGSFATRQAGMPADVASPATAPSTSSACTIPRESPLVYDASAEPNSPPGGYNLLVAGLTRDVDDVALRKMFEPFGEVVSAIVMLKANTATSRGFGFVNFALREDGEAAERALHGAPFGPNNLNVRPSKHDGHVEETSSVFVRNIPREVAPDTVKRVFEHRFGPIGSLTLAPGSTSAVMTGTIELESVRVAREAVAALHLVPFATIYNAVAGLPALQASLAPELPKGDQDDESKSCSTVPHAKTVIPPMLVKFAESSSARTQRYIKARMERSQKALSAAPAMSSGAARSTVPEAGGHSRDAHSSRGRARGAGSSRAHPSGTAPSATVGGPYARSAGSPVPDFASTVGFPPSFYSTQIPSHAAVTLAQMPGALAALPCAVMPSQYVPWPALPPAPASFSTFGTLHPLHPFFMAPAGAQPPFYYPVAAAPVLYPPGFAQPPFQPGAPRAALRPFSASTQSQPGPTSTTGP
jgi:hypothetical protein